MADKVSTVQEYLAKLPEDRREALEAVRQTILKNLDAGFEEGIQYGMIGYYVPHEIYPDGYHTDPKQPLPFASLASQKNHMSIYLFCIYTSDDAEQRFVEEWKKTGKKLDMGKSCVRFKRLEDVPLKVLGRAIKRSKLKKFIASYEEAIPASKRKKRAATKRATKKT